MKMVFVSVLTVSLAVLASGCQATPAAPLDAPSVFVPPTGPAAPVANALPFPQSALARSGFANPPALPSNLTQAEMEERILGLFANMLRYNIIVDSNANHRTRESFRIVFQHRSSWPGGATVPGSAIGNVHNITVSESHGYGMMILALMAGSEDRLDFDEWLFGGNIRDYFDAMVRTMQGFPSARSRNTSLMSWRLWGYGNDERDRDLFHATGNPEGIQVAGYRLVNGIRVAPFRNEGTHLGATGNSATDGDMDMIYALILADRQWGSDGAIDYMGLALRKLADFYRFCVHRDYRTLLLGDWASWSPGTTLGDATRASDFILSHLITFRDVDPAHDWQAVIDATLNAIWEIRSELNARGGPFYQNGLLPDFIVRQDGSWAVPPGQILESQHDGRWHWNSVRVPWRMGTTYILFGDMPVGSSTLYDLIIAPLDNFARTRPGGLNMGTMNMNGTLVGSPGPAMVRDFATPFVVTAAARGGHPNQWVDEFWGPRIPNGMHHFQNNVYGDYFRLISLITASGNYWIP